MKTLIVILVTVCTLSAMAQNKKYMSRDSEVIATLGMVRSALNLGGQYNMLSAGDLGFGAYGFLQTDKENNNVKVVYQTLSLGAQMKASLVQATAFEAYLSPGFGLHMSKDIPDGAAKSDVTALGPTLRIGVLRNLTPAMKLGLERFEMWNWLDVKGPESSAVYSAALSIEI